MELDSNIPSYIKEIKNVILSEDPKKRDYKYILQSRDSSEDIILNSYSNDRATSKVQAYLETIYNRRVHIDNNNYLINEYVKKNQNTFCI